MYIKSIELENIRSFEEAYLELSPNINILIGANNSGKSTIIKSVYKLQSERSLEAIDNRKGSHTGKALIHMEGFTDSFKIIGNRNPSVGVHFNLSETGKGNIYYKKDKSKFNLAHLAFVDREIERKQFEVISNVEGQGGFIYPFLSKRKTSYSSTQIGIDNTFSITDNLQNLPAKVQKAISQSFTRKKFDELCLDILGFTVGIIPADNNQAKIGIYAVPNSLESLISIDSMGEGVVNIIGLIIILLTENKKLFLIEELENDIHPKALKKMLDLIIEKSAENQFIISTHSNIVLKHLGSLDSSKIFYTDIKYAEGTNGSFIQTSTVNEISNSPQERLRILELLGFDLFDIDLYSYYLILEESSGEKFIRDIIIPIFFPKLVLKLRTIAANGTGDVSPRFKEFHRLFTYLHKEPIYYKRAWVFVDGDESGKKVIEELTKKFTTWENSHFQAFDKPNIELYFPTRFKKEIDNTLKKVGDKKRDAKTKLLQDVILWCNANLIEARKELSISAKEIIKKIDVINKRLGN